MRPKRRVAVIDQQEVSRRVRCFVLDVWGYRAIPLRHPGQLKAALADVAIVVLPRKCDWKKLVGVPVLSLDPASGLSDGLAQLSLSAKSSPMELREALRVLTARKRGPKPMRKQCNHCGRWKSYLEMRKHAPGCRRAWEKAEMLKAGRPKRLLPCRHCGKPKGVAEMRGHAPQCARNPREKRRSYIIGHTA